MEDSQALRKPPTVFLIDDDPSARRGLARLIQAAGYPVATFGSAREFLASGRHDEPGCMVLDIRMPELSGLDLQEQLLRTDYTMPIIFVTGHGDVPMSVQGMKRGAIDFLLKPVERGQLLEAIRLALEKDRAARFERDKSNELQQRLQLLTPREREVMSYVVAGLLNKQIAGELGITEATVKAHRGNLMEKLGVMSVAELVVFAQQAGLQRAKPAGHPPPR
jgi:FixJ family two-component response regulator